MACRDADAASMNFTLAGLEFTIHFLACESSSELRNVTNSDTDMGSTY